MKVHTTLITLAALLCGAAASLQAYPRGTPIMSPVTAVTLNGVRIVEVGASQHLVQHRLGKPERQMTDNTWLFENYKPSDEHLADHRCSKLMVTFENGRVARMDIVNDEAIIIVERRPSADPRKATHLLAQK